MGNDPVSIEVLGKEVGKSTAQLYRWRADLIEAYPQFETPGELLDALGATGPLNVAQIAKVAIAWARRRSPRRCTVSRASERDAWCATAARGTGVLVRLCRSPALAGLLRDGRCRYSLCNRHAEQAFKVGGFGWRLEDLPPVAAHPTSMPTGVIEFARPDPLDEQYKQKLADEIAARASCGTCPTWCSRSPFRVTVKAARASSRVKKKRGSVMTVVREMSQATWRSRRRSSAGRAG